MRSWIELGRKKVMEGITGSAGAAVSRSRFFGNFAAVRSD